MGGDIGAGPSGCNPDNDSMVVGTTVKVPCLVRDLDELAIIPFQSTVVTSEKLADVTFPKPFPGFDPTLMGMLRNIQNAVNDNSEILAVVNNNLGIYSPPNMPLVFDDLATTSSMMETNKKRMFDSIFLEDCGDHVSKRMKQIESALPCLPEAYRLKKENL